MEPIFVKTPEDYKAFVKGLQAHAKHESVEHKAKHQAILNTKRQVLYLPMKSIREIAKQASKGEPITFLKLCNGETYEEVLICGLVIAALPDLDMFIKYLDDWKEKIDNWSLCDSVVSSMTTLKKSKEKAKYFDYFLNLCYSEKEFIARLGIVTLMVHYNLPEYIDKILEMTTRVTSSAFYVQMALAWLLSCTFITFPEKTIEVLKSQKLDKFVQNKAISKCRDSFRISQKDKDMLVKFRKK